MPKSLESWALILSAIAIIVSIITWRKTHQIEKRQVDIDEARRRDEELSQRSAILKAKLEYEPNLGLLKIENNGLSEARNVVIKIDGEHISKSKTFHSPQIVKFTIGPQSDISFKATINIGFSAPKLIEITWDDDHATGKTYRNSLSY